MSETLKEVDQNVLKRQLSTYVPEDVQRILATSNIRDEYVFPAPILLETNPALVGYYRLLIGLPQKTFYGAGMGMGRFKRMETDGLITPDQKSQLTEFCRLMAEGLAELVRLISPTITQRDLDELPLLTIGSQFQGGCNNLIGQQATKEVLWAMADAVEDHIVTRTERQIKVMTPGGTTYLITLAGDPDVRIQQLRSGQLQNRVAIEIKGGTDRSNVHNRIGEAEKSHLKVKTDGYPQRWTIISKTVLDDKKFREESPTTTHWFDFAQVVGKVGDDWMLFSKALRASMGLPEQPE